MATVPVRLSATIKDSSGIDASTAFFAQADDTQTLAALDTEVAAWVTALDNCTDGVITEARATLFPALPGGIKASAVTDSAGGSDAEKIGLLGFAVSGTTKRYSVAIPAISNGATVVSNDRIVLTVTDPVGLLIKILTTVGTVLSWCSDHNQLLTKFVDALIAYRRKEKERRRSSFEVA